MPAVIQTLFAFEGQGQGWTETFYWEAADENLRTAEDIVTPIAQKRAKLLANGYVLAVGRNAVWRDTFLLRRKRETDIFEPRYKGVAAWKPATPNLALMCVWQSSNNRRSKKQYMRGIASDVGDEGKAPNLEFGVFFSNFNAWRSAMYTLQAGWIYTDVFNNGKGIVESYSMNVDTGIVTFTLKAPGITWPLGFGYQQRVYVSLPGVSPLDGPLMVIPASATTCTSAKAVGVKPFEAGQLGRMEIRTPDLVKLGNTGAGGQGQTGEIHAQRVVSHKTGNPIFASRGRAPARPKW